MGMKKTEIESDCSFLKTKVHRCKELLKVHSSVVKMLCFVIVYSSSFVVCVLTSFFCICDNSVSLGTISFQNFTLLALYLRLVFGFKPMIRYSWSCSVNLGQVTGEGPDSGGVGDLHGKSKMQQFFASSHMGKP